MGFMKNTLGKHLIIDFYNCKVNLTTPDDLKPLAQRALEVVQLPLLSWQSYPCDGDLVGIAISENAHICIHFYTILSYAAIDIYSFNTDLSINHMMGSLKLLLHSDSIKATSIRRGDFGIIRDMKPKRRTKITPIRRMKTTGSKIRKTSVTMFHMLRHPHQSHRKKRK